MVQVKFFKTKAHTDCEQIEKLVNNFLSEHQNDIDVLDIKYSAVIPQDGSSACCAFTAMIMFNQK